MTARRSDSQEDSQRTRQSGGQPENQTAKMTARRSDSQEDSQTTRQTRGQPDNQTANRTARQPDSQEDSQTTRQSRGQPDNQTAKRTARQPDSQEDSQETRPWTAHSQEEVPEGGHLYVQLQQGLREGGACRLAETVTRLHLVLTIMDLYGFKIYIFSSYFSL